ncbi:trans-sulfuration enzyme family protein [Oceanivirga salmonicida]|uniref:trans-sulfuration enzyme family protein n=1 Tax=Oceanivirga salmonicida TaxID=1769291 RepID=UPI000834A11B|nr:PLP-dependent aspartate aminotransferase family protein [Oceanivirga salmonicida]
MEISTKLLHGYTVIDEYTGSASVPKYQTSTFHQYDPCNLSEYIYSRFSNPTRAAVDEAVRVLEDAKYGVSFSSGMAAISTVLFMFNSGDHIIACKDIYGGTHKFMTKVLCAYGIEISFVDEENLDEFRKAIKPNTKAIYIETPSNPTLKITDIKGVVEICKEYNLISILDNTFMTPLLQKSLELGIDIVINSATKFLNGHSDVIAGVVATNHEEYGPKIIDFQLTVGNGLSVEDSWLLLRGLKTMDLRMKKSCSNATQIAQFLEENEKINKVYYPGLKSHKGHEIHMAQSICGGALVSFDVGTYERALTIMENVKVPIVAVSLGGVESILSFPAKMSHACMSKEEREELGVTDGLLRLSVGIEDVEDLIEDLKQAIDKI